MIRNPDRRHIARLLLAASATATIGAAALAGCGGGPADSTSTQTQHAAGTAPKGGISSAEKRAAQRRLAKKLGVSVAKVKHLGAGQGLAATSIRPGKIVPG